MNKKSFFQNPVAMNHSPFLRIAFEIKNSDGVLLREKFRMDNILQNLMQRKYISSIKQQLKNLSMNKVVFCDHMIRIFQIPLLEVMFFICGCSQLFDTVCKSYGDGEQINFKHIMEFYFKNFMRSDSQISFRLGEHLSNWKVAPKFDAHLEQFHFGAPQWVRKNPVNFLQLKTDSLITNPKAFKNPVKNCVFNERLGLFLISLEGQKTILIFKDNCE